jgi:hypothetical protein
MSLLENQADLLAIIIFVFALEFLVLLITIRMKQVKVKVFPGSTNRYSKLYENEIVVFLILIILGFMLTLIKNFILFASYDASMNFVGLEPLLSLIVIVLMAYLILLVLKYETKFSLILLFSTVFGILYVLNVDSFSQRIFTDRIIAATYVVKKGMYPSGLLDKAYDPIPFDVTIYSFLALILGIEPASILVFLIYPTLSLTITYILTWLLMVRYVGGVRKEYDVKTAFIIVFLSQISCWPLTITSHEALWSAWLLIALAEYSFLKILGNRNAEYSTTIVFLILVLASLFYHITVSTILLSLTIAFIIFMHIYGFQAMRIKALFSLFVIYTVLSFIKTYFIAEYPFSAFFSLLKSILALQYSEELAIYTRANILKSTNIYLRYAQTSPSLVLAIGLASIIFYIIRIFSNKTVKGKNNEIVISLSLSSTGFILLFMSFLSTFVRGAMYNTTFLRPAMFLLLLGAIPYIVEKAKVLYSNKKLFLIQVIVFIVVVGLAVNDVSITPRKGLYSPFIYVDSLDIDNLRYLKYVVNSNTVIIGFPEVSMYSQYLSIKYNYSLTTISSAKNIRNIYMDLYENHRIQGDLHRSLLVSINEPSIRPILFLLDEYSLRIYNSNIYVIHYIH